MLNFFCSSSYLGANNAISSATQQNILILLFSPQRGCKGICEKQHRKKMGENMKKGGNQCEDDPTHEKKFW